MSAKCNECRKGIAIDDLYMTNFKCGHEVGLCINCLPVADKEPNCFNCRSVTCIKCKQGVDKTKTQDFKSINFSSCKTKTHTAYVCKPCFQKSYEKLVDTKDGRHCYLCTSSIEKSNLIYYSKPLECPKNHQVVLCGKCEILFQKVKKRCPVCDPFDVVGGFSNHESRNMDTFKINYKTGKVKKIQGTGLAVSDKLHSLKAFGQVFIFGGNCFDKPNTKHSGKFKILNTDVEGIISGGYKGMKSNSVESIKSLLDCFGSESIEFNLEV